MKFAAWHMPGWKQYVIRLLIERKKKGRKKKMKILEEGLLLKNSKSVIVGEEVDLHGMG